MFFFFFFAIFDIARLGKIRQIHWKQRIEISKICQVLKLFVENERVRRYSSSKSPTDFTVVCMVSLSLAILLLLRHSFQWVDGFPWLVYRCQKLKKPWNGLLLLVFYNPKNNAAMFFYAKKVVSSLCDKRVKKGLLNFTATYVKLISIGFWK